MVFCGSTYFNKVVQMSQNSSSEQNSFCGGPDVMYLRGTCFTLTLAWSHGFIYNWSTVGTLMKCIFLFGFIQFMNHKTSLMPAELQ